MPNSSTLRWFPASAARQNSCLAISAGAPDCEARRQHHQTATHHQAERHNPPAQHFPAGGNAAEAKSYRNLRVTRAVWDDPQPGGARMKWLQQRAEHEDNSQEISGKRTEQHKEARNAQACPAEQTFQDLHWRTADFGAREQIFGDVLAG